MKYVVTINNKSYEVEVEKGEAQVLSVSDNAPDLQKPVETPVANAPKREINANGRIVEAPMPGIIVAINKTKGDKVKSGELLFIIEAMKMENEIVATFDGVVADILTSKGASVETGTPLIVIA